MPSVTAGEPGSQARSLCRSLAGWGQLTDKNCYKESAGRSLSGGFPQVALLQARVLLFFTRELPTVPNLSSPAAVPHQVPCWSRTGCTDSVWTCVVTVDSFSDGNPGWTWACPAHLLQVLCVCPGGEATASSSLLLGLAPWSLSHWSCLPSLLPDREHFATREQSLFSLENQPTDIRPTAQ